MNATATDFKPKTTEQVRADNRKRIIANAGKAAKRTSPKLASPLPKAAVSNPSPAMPGFNEQTKAKFDLAVRALK